MAENAVRVEVVILNQARYVTTGGVMCSTPLSRKYGLKNIRFFVANSNWRATRLAQYHKSAALQNVLVSECGTDAACLWPWRQLTLLKYLILCYTLPQQLEGSGCMLRLDM
jgi:hypothetical protein